MLYFLRRNIVQNLVWRVLREKGGGGKCGRRGKNLFIVDIDKNCIKRLYSLLNLRIMKKPFVLIVVV